MQTSTLRTVSASWLQRALAEGLLSGLASLAVLAWRGRTDTGSAAAPINAPSHWLWGRQALRSNDVNARYTLLGGSVHVGSALFWSAAYEWLQSRRRRRTPANAVVDAIGVAAVAAVVDLKLVPQRLTPGFERRLSRSSLALVYGSLVAGLALGGVLAARGHRH